MKKLMYLVAMSALLFACSDNDDPSPATESEAGVTFEISAVNGMQNGISRAPVYSQDATQHVTRVSVYTFLYDSGSSNYVYNRTFDITGWDDGTTFKRYTVDSAQPLNPGDYKFLAVGRDASDMFTITDTSTNPTFDEMTASITQSGNESEIFAGWSQATINDQGKGGRISIEMTRKVAGVLGYFKNVPQMIDAATVTSLRLTATDSNQKVNLTNGTAITTAVQPYEIININLTGQSVAGGVYTGNDLSGKGVVKLPNSQLGGSFFMPVSAVKLTLALYDSGGNVLKSWVVKDSGGSNTFDILANHFYSLGSKYKINSTDGGGTPSTNDDDSAIDLLTDQSIVISINPAWDTIHNLVIE